MKEIKDFAACARKQHYLNTCFLKHSIKISQSRIWNFSLIIYSGQPYDI